MGLHSRIENAQALLTEGRLANEAAVSSGVVLPILDALGWPVFDPDVVAPEYSVEGRRVDFALLTKRGPAVFVEVKQPGLRDGADRQLFEYAFHVGVPIALLTDGATWHFYLPAEQGTYQERRVYLLDLLERDLDESASRLQRYLSYDAVVSGTAYEQARSDYQRARRRREAKDALPRAWAQLVASEDERLVELIAAEVESASGYKPESADVLSYLRSLGGSREQTEMESAPPRQRKRKRPTPGTPRDAPTGRPEDLPSVGFMLDGRFHPARNGKEVAVKAVKAISDRHPEALDRMIERPKHGSSRRYLARRPEQLYPRNPDFADHTTTAEVKPGYWLMTHASHRMLERIVAMVCEDAGLRYGRDLRVRMK